MALKIKTKPLLDKQGNPMKPVAVHHHLILGLGKPPVWPVPKEQLQELWSALKMSKSKPDTCIFIHDSPEEIKRKIKQAFCFEGEVEFNPILDWVRYLIFRDSESKLEIKRSEKFGGNITYMSYNQLEKDFAEKKFHPMDLKNAVAEKLIQILEPARNHFEQPRIKKMLEELEHLIITQ